MQLYVAKGRKVLSEHSPMAQLSTMIIKPLRPFPFCTENSEPNFMQPLVSI